MNRRISGVLGLGVTTALIAAAAHPSLAQQDSPLRGAEPLAACPDCGAAVVRVISAPNLAVGNAHVLKDGHAAKHGFTQYRKVGKGVYEKAFGKGPDVIKG